MKYSKLNLANKLKQSPVEARHLDDREYNNDSAVPSHGMLQNFSLLFRRGGRYCDQFLSSLNCLLPTVCPSEWSYFNLSCYRTYRLNRVPSVEEADSLCRQTSARRCLYRSSVSTRPAVKLGSVLLELIVS